MKHDRRGSVAILIGLTAPVLVMALGLGIEVSRWSVAQVELQRSADAAAFTGALNYSAQTTKSLQTAATAAAYVARINGVAGTASPVWSAATQLLSDNQTRVQFIAGVRNASDTAIKVTVSQAVPLYLAGMLTTATSRTVSATAIAELAAAGTGPAACLISLSTTTGVSISNGSTLNISNGSSISGNGCTLRSNAGISIVGGSNVSGNVVAAGAVTVNNGGKIAPPFTSTSNAGLIADPFAGNTAVQAALTAAAEVPATAPAENCTAGACTTINPGNYTSISVSNWGTLTINPGLYYVNGPVDFGGGTVHVMGGVTFISTGSVTITNGVTVTGLAAATSTSATGGAIPGVLFATTSTGGVNFAGGTNFGFTGAIYAPKGPFSISNGVSNSTTGCAEVVANTISLTGGTTFASNCSPYGLPEMYSQQTTSVALVQ